MVEKVGDPVTPHVTFSSRRYTDMNAYMPLLVRDSRVSVQSFCTHCRLKVVRCFEGVRFVVALFSQYLEVAFLRRLDQTAAL